MDAEHLGTVELARNQGRHLGGDGLQENRQDEGHHAVAHHDALGRAHVGGFKDAGQAVARLADNHGVFNGLMGACQYLIVGEASIPLTERLKRPAVRAENHGRAFAGAFVHRIGHRPFQAFGPGFAVRDELAAVVKDRIKQGGAHLVRARHDVGNLLLVPVKVFAHCCTPLSGWFARLAAEASQVWQQVGRRVHSFQCRYGVFRGMVKNFPPEVGNEGQLSTLSG